MKSRIFLADSVPQTLKISGRMTLIAIVILVSVAMYLRPKNNNVAGSPAAFGVTTQVVAGGTVGRKVTFSVSPRLDSGTNR